MNRGPLQFIPFEHAVLCLDCHTVSNSEGVCQKCLSTALMFLSDKLGVVGEPTARLVTPIALPRNHTQKLFLRIVEVMQGQKALDERRKEAGIGEADRGVRVQQRVLISGGTDTDAGDKPVLLPGTHTDAADLDRRLGGRGPGSTEHRVCAETGAVPQGMGCGDRLRHLVKGGMRMK